MPVGEGYEVNPLGPEELSQNEQSFVGMTGSEGEGRRPELAARPVRVLGPYDPIPLCISSHAACIRHDAKRAIQDYSVVPRARHIREFEGGVYAL